MPCRYKEHSGREAKRRDPSYDAKPCPHCGHKHYVGTERLSPGEAEVVSRTDDWHRNGTMNGEEGHLTGAISLRGLSAMCLMPPTGFTALHGCPTVRCNGAGHVRINHRSLSLVTTPVCSKNYICAECVFATKAPRRVPERNTQKLCRIQEQLRYLLVTLSSNSSFLKS